MNQFATELANQLFWHNPLWYALIILVILLYIFRKRITGLAGEHWVKQELNKLPKEYKILNNVLIKYNDKTHQIDHLVISKYGLFIIETKQITGYITGNDYDKNWKVKAGNKTYYIYNPIHQNYGHKELLKEILLLNDNQLFPIVCISSNARVNVKSNLVLTIDKLINNIISYKEEILPNYEDIYNKLLELNITEKKIHKEHIKDTKVIKKNNESKLENKCPLCGGELVERKGYNTFIGCSNYPKCKYIKR